MSSEIREALGDGVPERSAAAGRDAQPGVRRAPRSVTKPSWETRLARYTAAVDVASLVLITIALPSVFHAYLESSRVAPPAVFGVISTALTLICLAVARAWDSDVLGQGVEEFNRVIRAVGASAVGIGLTGLMLEILSLRPWVFGFLPLAGLGSILGRYAVRKRLHRRRELGDCLRPMLVVGSVEAVSEMIERTRRDQYNGWTITAACTPSGPDPAGVDNVLDVPVLGDFDNISAVVSEGEYRAVAVTGSPGWGPGRLHRLAWELEELSADLIVDPGLMEVAGPRLHITPIDGMALLRLTKPTMNGLPRIVKNVVDLVGALALAILVAPILAVLATAVAADGGPVFYRQTRIGRRGRPFRMIKFRSMVVGADRKLAELQEQNEGAGPLFKMRSDPRVTRVGAFLRRFSLDELPQLFNVLSGSMSLVGPRPPLPAEVATYSRDASRKLLVKPGLTGLWQVSGRSDLSWDESVRIDLRYVENWSLAQDAMILWKTFGAVLRRTGAY